MLSEPYLSKLQESRKLMLFDVLTMMEGAAFSVLMHNLVRIWVQCDCVCAQRGGGEGGLMLVCALASDGYVGVRSLTSGRGRQIDVV